MLSLERILKRTRGSPKDIKAVFYDGTTKTLADHPAPQTLSFSERNEEIITPSGNPNKVDLELEKMQDIHDILRSHGEEDLIQYSPLDTLVKYIIADKRRFPVYITRPLFIPEDMADIAKTARALSSVICAMHKKGWVLFNIHGKSINRVAFSPQIILNAHPIDTERNQSIIMGSTIVSPYQVLHDILSSKYECDEIPYDTFKTKFSHFWGRVLPVDYRHVPDVCQFYHEMQMQNYNEMQKTDYIDVIIERCCVIKDDGNMVLKDPKKLVDDKELLFKVDWFAFAMVMDGWIEQVVERDPSASPTPEILGYFEKVFKQA
jgi:hypothetical protein